MKPTKVMQLFAVGLASSSVLITGMNMNPRGFDKQKVVFDYYNNQNDLRGTISYQHVNTNVDYVTLQGEPGVTGVGSTQAPVVPGVTTPKSGKGKGATGKGYDTKGDGADKGLPVDKNGYTGQDIVNYAEQFVGNDYKWGGNSLTSGCDCSGFVHLVYKHFGYNNLPRYSQSFKSVGKKVDSVSDILPGDIVVYPGHVAICINKDKIVEAQSRNAGITDTRSVRHKYPTAIRRIIN